MFKLIAFVAVCAVLVQADPVPFKCGEYPWTILKCIEAPKVIKNDIAEQCSRDLSPCEYHNCVYKKLGWVNDDKVIDQSKVAAYYDEVAKKYPLWADAVAVVKSECLVDNLPALGTERDCPTYDASQCAIARFIKVSQADVAVTPSPVRCGETPRAIYKCLGNPRIVKSDIAVQCAKANECERINCFFTKSGWMNADKVIDKTKVAAHFDQFAKEHPDWTPAVNQLKAACLAGPLPAQGWEVNCPTYDIMHCALTSFFKNAQPSQWSTAAECDYPRQYAAACPVCPENCFAAAIPFGSCNACRLLPQTP